MEMKLKRELNNTFDIILEQDMLTKTSSPYHTYSMKIAAALAASEDDLDAEDDDEDEHINATSQPPMPNGRT